MRYLQNSASLTPSQLSALAYATRRLRVFPCDSRKRPLVRWKEAASCDAAAVLELFRPFPCADVAWAISSDFAVVDLDGVEGQRDFARLEGVDALDFPTPTAATPHGGLHLFCKTSVPLLNAVRVLGTRIDLKTEGGSVVLPSPGNGRNWLKGRPWSAAPSWAPVRDRNLGHVPTAPASPYGGDTAYGRRALERATAAIVSAPCGAQEFTLNRESFGLGQLIGAGELGEHAIDALVAAACEMIAYREPWTNIESKVMRAVNQGRDRPRSSWAWA
jgi:hypothetical protein